MTEKPDHSVPPTLAPLLTSVYHSADRAWTGLQSFLVVQSVLAIAWATITGSASWPSRWQIAIVVSVVGIVTGFQWAFLGTRMWHYHLEYALRLRSLTESFTTAQHGPGATMWAEVDAKIDEYWRSKRLRWFKVISGNHWVLFLAPLFLATLHMAMLAWVLWFRPVWGEYVAVGAAVLFGIGFAAVWLFCKPILDRDFYQLRERLHG